MLSENKKMSIYVVGSSGQLGSEIRALPAIDTDYNLIFFSHQDLDISNVDDVKNKLNPGKDDVIINAAAYTNVDRAEEEVSIANASNHIGAKNLADIALASGCLLVHISTDYVFNGKKSGAYKETDATDPVSAYGTTKHQGEEAILTSNCRAIIIRTSWVFSQFGNNFVKTILRLARERDEISVIFEQTGTPTYAADLASAILHIINNLPATLELPQIYNYSNEGAISWFDFAKAIVEIDSIDCNIRPIETKDYPLPAKRPINSVLNKNKIKQDFAIEIPYWRDSLELCLKQINQQER